MKRLRFVVSLITLDNDYQVEQAVASEETARKLNLDVQVIFADGDGITQSQQLLEIIQSHSESRPDGIIMESAGATALPQVAAAAAKVGIGWVLLNRNAGYVSELRKLYRTPMFCVSCDNEMVGRIQGNQLVTLLPNGGSALYIQGPSDNVTAMQRTAGLCETKGAIQTKIVRAQWTEASSYSAVNSWLRLSTSRQCHIDAVAAQNDAMAMGARKAFNDLPEGPDRQRWLDVPYLGVDGVQKTGLSWVKKGLLRATITVLPNASKAVDMLARAVQTGVVPPEMTTLAPVGFPSLEQLGAPRAAKKYASSQT
jgi:ribose transport system substrate-binding protein